MAELDTDGRYRLSMWRGEFLDPLTERRFRQYIQPTVARYLCYALLVWAALWMAFLLTDYQQFGFGEKFFEALLVRAFLAALITGGAVLVWRRPQLATNGAVVTPLEVIGFSLFFALYFVSPAEICRSELRDSDILGRLGGEEFVIILPETDAEAAAHVAERLRAHLERTDVVVSQKRFRLTATFGVTELTDRDRDINDLVLRADQALYEGKQAGRNRVCAAG